MPTPAPESTLDLAKMPSYDEISKPDPAAAVNALDALFTESGGDPKKPEEPLGEPKEKAEPKAKEEPKEKAEPKTPKEIKPSIIEEDTKPPDEEPKLPKAEVPKPVVVEKDEFDAVELPPNAKPKTGDSFTQLKTLARERVAAISKEKEVLAKQVEELTAKTSAGLPKEVETELKTLREFRSKMDVEASPEFLTFDKIIAENTESIYAKLKAAGVGEEQLAKIKELGGPSEVDWDGPGVKLSSTLRRFLDSKLVENETLAEKKTKAIADAKANSESFLASRREASTESVKVQNSAVEKEIDLLLPKFPWLKELKPKDGASKEDIAAIAAHNAMVVDANTTLKDAVTDNSPAMRAILAVGYAQLLKTRQDFASHKAVSDATEKRLTAELEEAKTLLAKIKKSSTTRLRDTPAEEDTGKSKGVDLSTPGTDALDKHLAAIQAQKDA